MERSLTVLNNYLLDDPEILLYVEIVLHCFPVWKQKVKLRDVDTILNRRDLSVHRRVYRNPLLYIIKTEKVFSRENGVDSWVYFWLPAIIFIPGVCFNLTAKIAL